MNLIIDKKKNRKSKIYIFLISQAVFYKIEIEDFIG